MATSTSMRAFAPTCPTLQFRRGRVPPKSAFHTLYPNLMTPKTKTRPSRKKIRGSLTVSSAYANTWSNPSGAVLTPVVENMIWAAERTFTWNTIDVGGKMGVVKLGNGDLWIHSPVDLDEDTKSAIDAIGKVKHIVSPNYEHVKWAAQWKEAYPEAILYGCPGMMNKYPKMPWDREINEDGDDQFRDEFSVLSFAELEKNPVTQTPFFNEVLFVHKPSGVLLVTDIFWNYPASVPTKTKLWKFGMDWVYKPFYEQAMIVDNGKFSEKVDELLALRWDKILPCHGTFIDTNSKSIMKEFLTM